MTVRKPAQDHLRGVVRDLAGFGLREVPAHHGRFEAGRIRGADAAQPIDQMGLAHVGLAVRGRCQCSHHAGHAERAGTRMALSPSFRNDVHHPAPAALFPVVAAAALPVRSGRAQSHPRGIERRGRTQPNRRAQLVSQRLGKQASIRNERCQRRHHAGIVARIDLAAEQQIALATVIARVGAPAVPAECKRRRLHFPRSPAMRESLVGTEHTIEKARRIRAHQLAAHAVQRRCARTPHGGLLGCEPACAYIGIGQERRSHDRFDDRRRHCVVIHGRVEQRIGAIANRIRKPLVTARRAPRAVVFLDGAWREGAGQRFDAPACDIDDGDGGHPHHRVLEHAMTEQVCGIFLALHAQRATNILAPGVAGRRLLC